VLILNDHAEQIDKDKHRQTGESFKESRARFTNAMADDEVHFRALLEIHLDGRFSPGGRAKAALGSVRVVTPYNCFVSGTIHDSLIARGGILDRVSEAAQTMRMGGGIGYDFSPIRPKGDLIRSLDSRSSGPISFMGVHNAVCHAIQSAGHRRGAQMAVLRVDHPDIVEYIHAKSREGKLDAFNMSVGITDEFMQSVLKGDAFDLRYGGKKRGKIDARNLWDMLMRSTRETGDPGVLFIDRINFWNNLWYCETICATNPCGEQPLPPWGACLLGSFCLPRYIIKRSDGTLFFNYAQLRADIPWVVRGMDNIVDVATYPLPAQETEAKNKRRMGLGVMGLANAVEALGYKYGTYDFIEQTKKILKIIRNGCYSASVALSKEKGAFPFFNKEKYLHGPFIQTLPDDIRKDIAEHGIRNSHLLSIAPTGTISLCSNNVSSGIEPVPGYEYSRTVQEFDKARVDRIKDYGVETFGVRGKLLRDVSPDEHIAVLTTAQRYVDSSVSKTCNLPDELPWEEFKQVYIKAWEGGAKGCTTFPIGGRRKGVLQLDQEDTGAACIIDPLTGEKECN
jgi:ribonucleoside-diphosphate reductase alpha chain